MDYDSAMLLKEARARYTQQEIANIIGVNVRTVRRWEVCEPPPPPYLADALVQRILSAPSTVTARKEKLFTFIDLFAGIGGIRL
ncbi:MAG: hypothetical protein LBJ10_01985, partial [Clostridiales bacterium]|nr:hypothetical protein [Clostridiales bacterium]